MSLYRSKVKQIRLSRLRGMTAKWLFIFSIGLLGYCLFLIFLAFYHAAYDHMIPQIWGKYNGNHGPWRHYCSGRQLILDAFFLPLLAGSTVFCSILIQPKRRSKMLLMICLVTFFLIVYFLGWLIDWGKLNKEAVIDRTSLSSNARNGVWNPTNKRMATAKSKICRKLMGFPPVNIMKFLSNFVIIFAICSSCSDRTYVPKDLNDCFFELERLLPNSEIGKIKNSTESEMIKYHLGLGMWIRNNWGLWRGSQLSKWFNEKGIYHPDDMSGIILDSFWRHLNKKPISLKKQINRYQEYWNLLSVPKTDNHKEWY